MADNNEIYQRMESAYKEQSGVLPELKEKIILSLLAGELYALGESFEWYKAQAFPETAKGEYLERHCETYGMKRLEATKARGSLVFSRTDGLNYEVIIPAGTVCSDGGGHEYVCTEEGRMRSAVDKVTVAAEAVSGGSEYNCAAGTINTLVTKPAGVDRVTNLVPFAGGFDPESDRALRARLLKALSSPSGGYNREFYRREAMKFPGISSAAVSTKASGSVGVYVWGMNAPASEALISEIEEKLSALRELNVSVAVENAVQKSFVCYLYISPAEGSSFNAASVQAEAAVREFFSAVGVGDPVYLSALAAFVMGKVPLKGCSFASTVKDIPAEASVIPVLGSVTVRSL